jgi:WD40 repeat protein
VYGFHKSQVSAFQIHPNKTLVCSAERAITCPIIHIWDVSTLVLLKSIKTRHKGESIFKIEFSRQGTHVLTLAGYCHEEAYQSPKPYMLSNPNFSNNGSQSRNNQLQPYQNSLDYISVEVM